MRRSLGSVLFSLAFVAALLALPAAPTNLVDLVRKTSVVGYDFDPGSPDATVRAKALASAKVRTLDGGWTPWTEAAVKANARVQVVGKVDPVTHQPVGAVAVNPQTDCEPGNGFYAPFSSCLAIWYHINQPSGTYTWYNLDSWLRRSDCFDTGTRYSNLYAPSATNLYATSSWVNGSCSNGVYSTYQGNSWWNEARIFNANSRAHTTWYNYPDGTNGHPLIFIP